MMQMIVLWKLNAFADTYVLLGTGIKFGSPYC